MDMRIVLLSLLIVYVSWLLAFKMPEEHFDVLTEKGAKTGQTAPRGEVHAKGIYHRAVHTWLFCPSTGELLLQQRASCKDSWADRWDISSAGHLSAGQDSLPSAVRELWEELGLLFAPERFQYLFTHLELLSSIQKGKPFINNEFNDVYVVCVTEAERAALDPATAMVGPLLSSEPPTLPASQPASSEGGAGSIPSSSTAAAAAPLSLRLQDVEVRAVRWLPWRDVRHMYEVAEPSKPDEAEIVPLSDKASYGRLWPVLERMDQSGLGPSAEAQ